MRLEEIIAMTMDNLNDKEKTRHLGSLSSITDTPPMPFRITGPLDEVLPWVLEFRVVGTPSTIQVRVKEFMTIGRGDPESGVEPEVNLSAYGAHVLGVSRRHAAILAQGDRITVKDVGSSNGTRLNGYALTPNQEYRLRHGDELTFGQLHVQVLFAVVPLVKESDPQTPHTVIPKLGQGQHVLIVEDDADVASVFGMILEHAGFRVTVMNNAVAALGFISQKLPDALVLDLLLPDMSGLDLAAYVRKQETPGQHVPVIVVSGATGGFQMNQALKAGADMFLGKPVGVDELVRAFSALMPQLA
jgi:CheY-like chemotaxis protein